MLQGFAAVYKRLSSGGVLTGGTLYMRPEDMTVTFRWDSVITSQFSYFSNSILVSSVAKHT